MFYNVENNLHLSEIVEMFDKQGRGNQFTEEGIEAIMDFLVETSDSDKPIKIDVIGLCCDFNEDTPENIIKDFDYSPEDYSDCFGDYDIDRLVSKMNTETWAIKLNNGNILHLC